MWIKNINGKGLVNSDNCLSFSIAAEDERHHVVANRAIILATYQSMDDASMVLDDIYRALTNGNKVYDMPLPDEVGKLSDGKIKTDVKKTDNADIKKVIDLWNTLVDVGIKPVERVSPSSTRYKMLSARLRQYKIDDFEKAIENIRQSEFLHAATFFNFDWFVRPSNFPKVLDGNYNDNSKTDDLSKDWFR